MKKENKSKNEILEIEIQNIRDELNDIDDILDKLDNLVEDDSEDDSTSIKDLDDFIYRLKTDNLYTPEIERFIEEYIKWYNN